MQAGTLTREQLLQRGLELDPFDTLSLAASAHDRYEAGDVDGAAEYYWRAASADPWRFEPWFKLAACLSNENRDLRNGIMEMGARKALRDPEGLAKFKESFKSKPKSEVIAANFTDGEFFLEVMAEQFGALRDDEPEEVSQRLRPHRLVDDLLEDAEDGLDTELVDGILEDGVRCGPLLIGVLRGMATGPLPEGDAAPVVASLALLGEIGDPAVLPELIECYTVDEEDIADAAHWAVKRIAARRPVESLEEVRKLVPAADADRRWALAMAVGDIPPQPGKQDVLLSLLDGLADFPQPERVELFVAVAMALSLSGGPKGRELGWSLLSRHAAVLPKRTRADLREAYKLQGKLEDEMSLIVPTDGDEQETTVYDLCCEPWEDDEDGEDDSDPMDDDDEEDEDEEDEGDGDEDDEDEGNEDEDFIPEPVHRPVMPGRNDPCWCGSGKKYKKCHLESDEKSRRSTELE